MYKVEVASDGNYKFIVKAKSHELVVDAKGAEGITPPDVLLASLGSCVGVYIRKYAEGARLELGRFNISVEADLGTQAPLGFRQIKVTIDLAGATLDERRKKAIVDFIKHCPIHNTLKSSPAVDITIS